eukprot:Clim_evm20s246 gene=Clim_evmTU20s246
MGRLRRKRVHKNDKSFHRKYATKKRTKDLDQIQEDMATGKMESQAVDYDLPGLGQYYCTECTRYFQDAETLKKHKQTKNHKKRVKLLKDEAYTQEEAERAAGMGKADNGIITKKEKNQMQE